MNRQEFESIVQKDGFQVFLFCCPISIPLNFISHTWVVINRQGLITRFDVLRYKYKKDEKFGYLHVNVKEPWEGFRIFPMGESPVFQSVLLGMIEGGTGSVAEAMVNFIDSHARGYVYAHTYRYMPGPNSNTFIQWILDKFPETGLQLPKNALGKGYKKC